ncbi:hypothetical protein E2C01_068718 [Portunus trituberculatus]|uniref:Uncharacterized protein n=1 Tax=Portunus trituberculatus TaxID=210409 RepID=A0A5B7HN46_PORTR|nr:hypothetical protein [Portunus trituberculatus]
MGGAVPRLGGGSAGRRTGRAGAAMSTSGRDPFPLRRRDGIFVPMLQKLAQDAPASPCSEEAC